MIENNSHRDPAFVLAINAGSSSIRFALYDVTEPPLRRMRGKIEQIGLPGTTLAIDGPAGSAQRRAIDGRDHSSAASTLIDWLEEEGLLSSVKAVGHRVVHGGSQYSAPAPVDDDRGMEVFSESYRRRLPLLLAIPTCVPFPTYGDSVCR